MAFRQILLNVQLIFFVIIILSTSKFTKSDTTVQYNGLNDIDLIPLHYDVKIKFDLYRNIFSGNCYTKIQIFRPTKNITIINSKNFAIKLRKIDLINDNNQIINIQKYCFIDKTYIYLDFTQSSADFLSPGTYILKIKYKSTISDDEDIFGDFFYTDKEEEKVLNDQSTIIIRARQLFPCLNDTVFKSTFNISIKHHKNYHFLSNMPICKKIDDLNNMLWTQFCILSMSAEHLAFVVTIMNYDSIYLSTIGNVKFWHREEITDQMRYAKIVVRKVVQYLIQKTTRKAPRMKYIVIKDFYYSNVKIRGIILLREEDVIYNDTLDHIARKMEVANLIARETISHWYDDVFLWSKDGFIAFLAAHILNQAELYRMDLFVVQTLQESLRFDTLFSFHTNDSIVHSFRSSLHYIKSSVIWRMLYYLISDNVFWTSINKYVNTQYNQTNATTNNVSIVSFWTAMESALNESYLNNVPNLNIKDLVVSWSWEGYYPVLYVTRNDTTNLTLILHSNFEHANLLLKQYRIYLTYTTNSVMYFGTSSLKHWLTSLLPYYYISDVNYNDWIIVNLQQVGYYRVNYDEDYWRKLEHHLYFVNYTDIPVSNRAQIIDDAFDFMTLGQLKFDLFKDIISFLLKDTDYVAWYPMIKAIEYMTCIWAIQDGVIVKNQIKEMFHRLLQNIGYDDEFDESNFTKCLREEAVKWACVFDASECRKTATLQLEKYLESFVQDKVLKWKEWVYCKGLMAANISIWRKVLNKWNATSDNTLLEYLTCSTNTNIIQIYLGLMREDKFYLKVSIKKAMATFLLIAAKHTRKDKVLFNIFDSLIFDFTFKDHVERQIAVLIVIITHEHNVAQFKKVIEFVEKKSTISSKRLNDFVKQKIDKRKKEYQKQIASYGRIHK